ncbi:hypothetical protein [Candidatus Phytoplasma solani]|uniref:Uncharacterized protein n=1 Tax=Candidatus Phytoplasma solani TaxID=69896 RepID=A0A421NY73_9MOLU|nr:hypothetical protein [Candidatus Phytoplasma solani]RMI88870.1 hypothetical protein PSSA1_v1c2970 [Candidatus Phytoplasma solani]CCP88810.1 hypothetical protein S231_03530 [Candidatus Phytoplasma solani]
MIKTLVINFFYLLLGLVVGVVLGCLFYFQGLVHEPKYQKRNETNHNEKQEESKKKQSDNNEEADKTKEENDLKDKFLHFWFEFVNDNILKKVVNQKMSQEIKDTFNSIWNNNNK